MGYKLFPNTPLLIFLYSFSLPLGGLIGAAPGLYYQTLLNWVHNTEPIRRNIFLASPELRRELMPRWMDVNNPPILTNILKDSPALFPAPVIYKNPHRLPNH